MHLKGPIICLEPQTVGLYARFHDATSDFHITFLILSFPFPAQFTPHPRLIVLSFTSLL